MKYAQILAREGFCGSLILAALFVVFFWCFGWGVLSFVILVILGFWLFTFRNPERLVDRRVGGLIVSPCDGVITNIQYIDKKVILNFRISVTDVGLLRSPIDTPSLSWSRVNGLRAFFADNTLKQCFNTTLSCQASNFKLEVISEIFNPSCYELSSDIFAGDRIGFCKSGWLELELDASILELQVNIGDRVKGGYTSLGYKK